MRFARLISSKVFGKFVSARVLALLGLGFTLMGLGLPAVGIQLGPVLGGGVVILGVLCILGAVITFFSPPQAEEQHAEGALQKYFGQIRELLHDNQKPLLASKPGDEVRTLARTYTLNVLPGLDPQRKRRALQFIYELGLIRLSDTFIFLDGADLSNANLSGMALTYSNLGEANLRGADLSGASLSVLARSSAGIQKAMQKDAPDCSFERAVGATYLRGANLSRAVLKETTLAGCEMIDADFGGANLEDADLRGADLRMARNLTEKQLARAYGTYQQDVLLHDTLLPGYLKAPPAWSKLVHEQKQDKERRRGVIRRVAQLLRLRTD